MAALVPTRHGPVAVHEQTGPGPGAGGAPLVLLHANPGDHRDFAAVRPQLAAGRRTYALDWPGYGDSPAPADPWAMSAGAFAAVLIDAVAELGLGPTVFVANSVGGYAAIRLAVESSDAVRALVLTNSAGFSPVNPLTRAFCRTRGTAAATRWLTVPSGRIGNPRPNAEVRALLSRYRQYATDPVATAVQAAVWRSFARPESDLRVRARAVTAPTLLAWGRRDPIVGVRDARRAAAAIPGARLALLDAGHAAFAGNPSAFLAAVLPFLAEHG